MRPFIGGEVPPDHPFPEPSLRQVRHFQPVCRLVGSESADDDAADDSIAEAPTLSATVVEATNDGRDGLVSGETLTINQVMQLNSSNYQLHAQ